MTILEAIKTMDEKDVAKMLFDNRYGTDSLVQIDFAEKCWGQCEYCEEGWTYEESWLNGICKLIAEEGTYAKCPKGIDRDKVAIDQIQEWLNSEVRL